MLKHTIKENIFSPVVVLSFVKSQFVLLLIFARSYRRHYLRDSRSQLHPFLVGLPVMQLHPHLRENLQADRRLRRILLS